MKYRKCIQKVPEIACMVLIIVSSPNQFIFIVLHKLSVATEGLNGRTTQNPIYFIV